MAALTSENNFQTSLVQDINMSGGYAFKASNMYTTGVPDLAITPGIRWPRDIKIECKFMKIDANFRSKTMKLSRPQELHLRRTVEAGGRALWVVGYTKTYMPGWGMFVLGHNTGTSFKVTADHLDDTDHPAHIVKQRGVPWDIAWLFDLIFKAFDPKSNQSFLNGKPV